MAFLTKSSSEDLKKEITFFTMTPLGESLEIPIRGILRFLKSSGKCQEIGRVLKSVKNDLKMRKNMAGGWPGK